MLSALQSQITAAFMLSLLGGLHCAGMCGGFAGALQLNRPSGVPAARLALGYHAGRVASYTSVGTLAGALGGSLFAADVLPVQLALLIAGGVMLLVIGGSMLGRGSLRWLEPLTVGLWRAIAPLARRAYPPRTGARAVLAGLVWGFVPCGMVYAALPLALVAGGAWQGAAVMLAFGLGTSPNMVALDRAVMVVRNRAERARGVSIAMRQWMRSLAGMVIVAFGLSGLAHAARVAGAQHPAINAVASLCHQ